VTGFAIGALVLLGLTLLLLGWPLWSARRRGAVATDASQIVTAYRDQLSDLRTDLSVGTLDAERFEQSRRELDHRLLQEIDAAAAPVAPAAAGSPDKRGGWIVIALFVLALPIGLYWRFGAVGAFDPALAARGPTVTPQQVEAMVGRLQAHLKEVPSDGEGWMMLGRSYNVLGRYAEAADAYGHAAPLTPDDAQFFADYADALAMANGRSLDGEPMKLVQRALQIDPANPKALALAGTFAFENRSYPLAIQLWQRAQAGSAQQDPEFAAALENSIAEARERGGLATAAPASPPASVPNAATNPAPESATAAAGAASVRGRVTLAPALAAKAEPGDTVFIFARAEQGPRMPLALLRRQVKDLPLDFTLDDSNAMMPQLSLSKFGRVVIGARISKSGDAAPHPGDLRGESGPVAVGASGVSLEIAEVVP
jgi:cytochrome c-type biogenesis protein CcmH